MLQKGCRVNKGTFNIQFISSSPLAPTISTFSIHKAHIIVTSKRQNSGFSRYYIQGNILIVR